MTRDRTTTEILAAQIPEPVRRHGKTVAVSSGALAMLASLGGNALQAWEAHDVRLLKARQQEESELRCNERVGEAWRQYREHLREVHGL